MKTPYKYDANRRRAFRVLRMVSELHRRGYQRLRIVPMDAPSGLYWRCSIFPAHMIARDHGANIDRDDVWRFGAHYTSASDNEYFGWTDAKGATAGTLADLFVDRFPQLASWGEGRDWAYVGWFFEMLQVAERGGFPVAVDEYSDADGRHLPTTGYYPDNPRNPAYGGQEPLKLLMPPAVPDEIRQQWQDWWNAV